jgi:hypothetical protein
VGDLEGALANHERALVAFREVVDPCSEGLCRGRLAMALAASGRDAEARSTARHADRLLHIDDPVAISVLRLFEVFIDAAAGDAPEVTVRERLAEVRACPIVEGAALVDLSDDARTAVRLIESFLATRGARGPTDVLLVGPDARWFTPPAGGTFDLGRRDVLRRLFVRLVEQHRRAPAEGLSLDALREAGWPREQMSTSAAVNRVHVALTELRRRGLKRCLLRKQDKYLLDPAIRVDLSEG